MNPWAIPQGVLAALAVCLCSFVLSWKVGRNVEALGKRNHGAQGVGKFYAEIVTRFLTTVTGTVGVFLVFGPEWGIPCALSLVPLYMLGLICGVGALLRDEARQNTSQPNTSNEAESNS